VLSIETAVKPPTQPGDSSRGDKRSILPRTEHNNFSFSPVMSGLIPPRASLNTRAAARRSIQKSILAGPENRLAHVLPEVRL
jgi:hypothetical protein